MTKRSDEQIIQAYEAMQRTVKKMMLFCGSTPFILGITTFISLFFVEHGAADYKLMVSLGVFAFTGLFSFFGFLMFLVLGEAMSLEGQYQAVMKRQGKSFNTGLNNYN